MKPQPPSNMVRNECAKPSSFARLVLARSSFSQYSTMLHTLLRKLSRTSSSDISCAPARFPHPRRCFFAPLEDRFEDIGHAPHNHPRQRGIVKTQEAFNASFPSNAKPHKPQTRPF